MYIYELYKSLQIVHNSSNTCILTKFEEV